MGTTPTKGHAAARVKPARLERTIRTELPQELSRLAAAGGFFDGSSCPTAKSAARSSGRKKAERPKKAGTDPKTRQRAVITITGFIDDGHPTILADPRGWSHRS
jgi:hypothetical protein